MNDDDDDDDLMEWGHLLAVKPVICSWPQLFATRAR